MAILKLPLARSKEYDEHGPSYHFVHGVTVHEIVETEVVHYMRPKPHESWYTQEDDIKICQGPPSPHKMAAKLLKLTIPANENLPEGYFIQDGCLHRVQGVTRDHESYYSVTNTQAAGELGWWPDFPTLIYVEGHSDVPDVQFFSIYRESQWSSNRCRFEVALVRSADDIGNIASRHKPPLPNEFPAHLREGIPIFEAINRKHREATTLYFDMESRNRKHFKKSVLSRSRHASFAKALKLTEAEKAAQGKLVNPVSKGRFQSAFAELRETRLETMPILDGRFFENGCLTLGVDWDVTTVRPHPRDVSWYRREHVETEGWPVFKFPSHFVMVFRGHDAWRFIFGFFIRRNNGQWSDWSHDLNVLDLFVLVPVVIPHDELTQDVKKVWGWFGRKGSNEINRVPFLTAALSNALATVKGQLKVHRLDVSEPGDRPAECVTKLDVLPSPWAITAHSHPRWRWGRIQRGTTFREFSVANVINDHAHPFALAALNLLQPAGAAPITPVNENVEEVAPRLRCLDL